MLRIAFQKSGRLSESSLALLHECGISLVDGPHTRRLRTLASNFPIEVLFLRDDDIPRYVQDGIVDVGIVGTNVIAEQGSSVRVLKELGFARCRLSLAVPKGSEMRILPSIAGKRIATSYPKILGDFLSRNRIQAQVQEISGSVEVAPSVGLADLVCDLVGTGSTLVMNGLSELATVMECQAVLIGSNVLTAEKERILDRFLFRISAVLSAEGMKYVVLNAPRDALDKIISLLPGIKSPTVVPLAEEGWCAVHSMVHEDRFWDILENLKGAGAEGIVVVPVEKIIR